MRFFQRLFILALLLSLGVSPLRAGEHWVTYQDCRLIPNPANDGDSFHVRAGRKEFIFRLYFVDTPETDASLPERVAEQAKYFRVSVPQTLQIGAEAERFTREKLSRPFTVETCKEDARGRSRLPRYFAFVEMGSEDLAETLVRNGLARVYGAPGHPPDRAAPATEKRKLEQLERNAKSQKLGGWGVEAGRLNTRATTSPSGSPPAGADSFEAFFHPKKLESAPNPGAKLDVNSASVEALQALPGIGPVLAERIIAARPFQSADELQRVQGIGAKKYGLLRPFFQ
jgi:DNA uptake protein ComE-like DNA-binding protein